MIRICNPTGVFIIFVWSVAVDVSFSVLFVLKCC